MAVKHNTKVASGNTPKGKKKGGMKNKTLQVEAKGKGDAKGGKGGAKGATSLAVADKGGKKRKLPEGELIEKSETKKNIKLVGGNKPGTGKGGAKGGKGKPGKQAQKEGGAAKQKRQKHKTMKRKRSKEKLKLTEELRTELLQRQSGRQFCTLYVRFPRTVIVTNMEEVKETLGAVGQKADIIRLTRPIRSGKYTFCYIEFKTPEETKEAKAALNKMEVGGEKFFVDEPRDYTLNDFDPLKLHVSDLKVGFKKLQLLAAFPSAKHFIVPKMKDCTEDHRTYAFIQYGTTEEAIEAFWSSKDLKILDQKVLVSFAIMKAPHVEQSKDESDDVSSPPPAKKAKVKQSAAKEETKTSLVKSGKKTKAAVVVKEEEKMEDDDEEEDEEVEEEDDDGVEEVEEEDGDEEEGDDDDDDDNNDDDDE